MKSILQLFFTGSHCIDELAAPPNTNLVNVDGLGGLVPINTPVTFECQEGMKGEVDFGFTSIQKTCLTGNVYEGEGSTSETDWPPCTDRRTI